MNFLIYGLSGTKDSVAHLSFLSGHRALQRMGVDTDEDQDASNIDEINAEWLKKAKK